jgi:hypothetical protein
MSAPVYANVEYRDPATHHDSVNLRSAPGPEGEDLCLALVAGGLATVLTTRREKYLQPLVDKYQAQLKAAKTARRGQWKYGDLSSADDAKVD